MIYKSFGGRYTKIRLIAPNKIYLLREVSRDQKEMENKTSLMENIKEMSICEVPDTKNKADITRFVKYELGKIGNFGEDLRFAIGASGKWKSLLSLIMVKPSFERNLFVIPPVPEKWKNIVKEHLQRDDVSSTIITIHIVPVGGPSILPKSSYIARYYVDI